MSPIYDSTEHHERDVFLTEICESGDALRRTAGRLHEQKHALHEVRRRLAGRRLILTGMGSSADAVTGLASVLGRSGRESTVINTAELLHFRLPSLTDQHGVIIVSQSGHSVEAVKLMNALAGASAIPVVVVTNLADSPLADAADFAITLGAGVELGPSSKTYVATMLVMQVLAELLAGDDEVETVLARAGHRADGAAAALAAWIGDAEGVGNHLADWIEQAQSLFVVGRGAGVTAAELNALVLKESAHVPAQSLDAAEFRHGPLELAAPGLAVALICVEPSVAALDARLRTDLLSSGAAVVTIGVDACRSDDLPIDYVLPGSEPLIDAGLSALPLLLAAWAEASRRSETPGAFSVGAKVTTCE
ncbi:SIS domain-containing protein [Actinomyces ruminicola]|uniref:Glutamine--fructose-6-phosphate aminotransferase [isomerizing] n=1 Tax=Actinomyces ruminicola TaxID=332524 RepID=A0A1G9RRG1_9ACTO|nr:SIS domain-containing protein [Actinomyces ruminicola]SDM25899.1 glucosamine--fructose-6-phosphate aminotransferase (isomerizing) [Actinomyces ruminicola]